MFKKCFLSFLLLMTGLVAFGQDIPPASDSLVTDYTNTLPAQDKLQLEHKLVAFDDSTSSQIAVVIIKTTNGDDIDDYAQKLGHAWGIGQKGTNNGILILVAIGDRKVSIQTGYGAERAVSDVAAHDIITNDIRPRFKADDYYGGLDAATDDLITLMSGKFRAAKAPQKSQGPSGGNGSVIVIIIIIIVVLFLIFRRRGGGGGGQIYGGRGGASPFWWFLGGTLLGSASNGWGGFSNGGGGISGNDGGGGDFGGFGGGDFGGGGSSGSW
jgi:uncharacterized protein